MFVLLGTVEFVVLASSVTAGGGFFETLMMARKKGDKTVRRGPY